MSSLRLLACAAVLALAGSCTSPGGGVAPEPGPPPGTPTSSGTSSGSASDPNAGARLATPTPPPPRACYRLRFDELARPTNGSAPVPCTNRHNTTTIHVGRLDTLVGGRSVAVDSELVQRRIARTCPQKLAAFVGGTRSARALSRFSVVWFSPTLEEADRGADWFRCDLIAFAAHETLLALPPRGRLQSVLDRDGSLTTYGLCGTAAPGTAGFERVICSRRHSWRATSTIALPGGHTYPGTARVRSAGNATCKERVRAARGFSIRFRYGWEWPSRDQWDRGQRYGYCWAPAP